ncbi:MULTISPECIES: hypothetical protein [unclassified Aeromicrobium]|uniref:hypothetical protein n=1 Tax=unclassified Aeromicrobium TaxID=2633570 RepID=UPI0006F79AFF|nr:MULTISPECIES: hypothetical protein [unclassified Aeromicrobium]KQP78324.1 hypothetical protein ASF37_07075 [Aeromicrobium sp. Leaf289]
MRNTTVRRLLAGTAAALCLAVGVGPAGATGNSVTVAVGGTSAQALHPVTATMTQSVRWESPFFTWSCSSAKIPSSPVSDVQGGAGVTDVLTVRAMSFQGCGWPGGSLPTASAAPATLHVTGPASSSTTDQVRGHLDDLTIVSSNAICDFTVTGSATAVLDEATQRLAIEETGFTGNLTVSKVRGCLGQVQNGQAMNLRMSLQLTSPDGAINIS